MLIEIKNRFTGSVIFSHDVENNTIKLTVEFAVKCGARLDGASLDGARLDGARLDGARLDGARLVGASLDRARLDGASLDGASLDRASLVGARLDGASLVGATYGIATFKFGFKQYLGAQYFAIFFDAHIKIGCKFFSTEEWRNFTDKEIVALDGKSALKFWREQKTVIMAIADAHQKGNENDIN